MQEPSMSATPVVTRFAPSPTGYLHIGGARTALFNWLFARHHGGQFLLRIEDTDIARSTPEATAAILDGMQWLGLDHDGEAVSQAGRIDIHAAAVERMIERGTAYRCYATKEQIDAARDKARAEKRPLGYDSPWRDEAPNLTSDMPFTVRLKAPREGETVIEDAVQGRVAFGNEQLDDLILLRSDGTPTYMLAVVVDDHDMGVTHVIRGDDHLTNAARQTLIYRALGWETPIFAHIPLIHGPDGAKLSKRHGALGVGEYREMGYLPEAMRNYLARLGWSHGDDEFFTTEQATGWFGLDGINKSAARFDFAKLENLNGQHMRVADDAYLADVVAETMARRDGPTLTATQHEAMREAMPGLKERAKTIVELADSAYYIYAERPLDMDAKAAKLLSDDARTMLSELTSHLRNATEWRADLLEDTVKTFAADKDLKLGKVAQPMRAALTGRASSPGIYDVMITLGRDEALARLDDRIAT